MRRSKYIHRKSNRYQSIIEKIQSASHIQVDTVYVALEKKYKFNLCDVEYIRSYLEKRREGKHREN